MEEDDSFGACQLQLNISVIYYSFLRYGSGWLTMRIWYAGYFQLSYARVGKQYDMLSPL